MKIQYKFVNETVVVEVEESIGSVVIDLDRQEYNNNQTETRRHCSLEAYDLDGNLLPSDENVEAELISKEDRHRLYEAISKLTEKQQRLIHALFFEGLSAVDYAKKCGVDASTIRHEKQQALNRLKKLL